MLIEYYRNPSTTINTIYALIFDESGHALKLTAGLYAMATFTKAAITNFAIPLAEGTERTLYNFFTTSDGNVTLADTGSVFNPIYTIEYWSKSGSTPNRTTDTFLGYTKMAYSSNVCDQWEISLTAVYDPTSSTLTYTVWAELNGQIYTDMTNVDIEVRDQADTSLLSHAIDNTLGAAIGTQGQFVYQQTGVTLVPDTTYFAKATITDANSFTHSSGNALVCWD